MSSPEKSRGDHPLALQGCLEQGATSTSLAVLSASAASPEKRADIDNGIPETTFGSSIRSFRGSLCDRHSSTPLSQPPNRSAIIRCLLDKRPSVSIFRINRYAVESFALPLKGQSTHEFGRVEKLLSVVGASKDTGSWFRVELVTGEDLRPK
jgi:hypothetical protein